MILYRVDRTFVIATHLHDYWWETYHHRPFNVVMPWSIMEHQSDDEDIYIEIVWGDPR